MRTGSTRPGERVTKRAGRWARGWRRRRRRRWRSRWRWCFSLALCDAKRAASEDSRPHEAIVGTIDHRLLVPHRRTYITQKTASLEPTAKRAISHRRIHQIEKKAAPDSVAATKRVPTQTAPAPMAMAAASPRPSKIPPAATTSIGCPVCFELRAPVHLRAPHPSRKECPRQRNAGSNLVCMCVRVCACAGRREGVLGGGGGGLCPRHSSMTLGSSMLVGISPVCPPASPP